MQILDLGLLVRVVQVKVVGQLDWGLISESVASAEGGEGNLHFSGIKKCINASSSGSLVSQKDREIASRPVVTYP